MSDITLHIRKDIAINFSWLSAHFCQGEASPPTRTNKVGLVIMSLWLGQAELNSGAVYIVIDHKSLCNTVILYNKRKNIYM